MSLIQVLDNTTNLPTNLKATSNSLNTNIVSGSATVSGTVGISEVVPGTAATDLGKAVAGTPGASDTGVAIIGIRKDTPVTITPTDGKYTRLMFGPDGSAWMKQSPFRNTGVQHRSGITSIDKIATAGQPTGADGGAGTTSLSGTNYYCAVAAGNTFGTSGISAASAAIAITSAHYLDITVAQVTGATYYDIFVGTDATTNLKHVGRITEAQRAAGTPTGTTILTAETIGTAGANAAGTVRVGAAGAGITAANAVFSANNAYALGTITPITCTGYNTLYLHVKMVVDDLRSAPSLSLVPIFTSSEVSPDYYTAVPINVPILNGSVGQTLKQMYILDVKGATSAYILVGSIAGQNASVSIWAEPA